MRIHGHRNRGFTMVEIAICVAIIAFALVGIVGLLPRGLQTQRDARASTIVGQDALYWLDAIRSGARGLDELTNYVQCIEIDSGTPPLTLGNGFTNGYGIVGILCTEGVRKRAIVRAISGAAVDRADAVKDLAFRYVMDLDIQRARANAFPTNVVEMSPSRLWNVRLSFRWPVRGTCPVQTNAIGSYSRIVRSMIAGKLVEESDGVQTYSFFEP